MLIEFKVTNFLSIKEEINLSLDSSSTKKLNNNRFEERKYKLLKSAAIYGANASGKSNIIKAIKFAQKMIKESNRFTIDQKIGRIPYLLSEYTKKEPSKFEFTFIKNNTKYIYGFSCNEEQIIEEYLLYNTKGKVLKEYFRRNEINNKKERFEFKTNKQIQTKLGLETTNKKLYLPFVVNDRNFEELKEIYEFIVSELIIVTKDYHKEWAEYTHKKIHEDEKFKKWILEIMKTADFGGITNINTKSEIVPVNEIEFKIDEGKLIHKKETTQELINIEFVHKTEEGKEIIFPNQFESEGTRKTIHILGPIYDILEKGKVLIIDEFELNLHPNITEFIMKLFHSKHNKKNGQLIVTTHDTTLLKNKNLFRLDQIYICSKEPNKATRLRSLIEFDLRESLSFENAYLEGRVGGLPFINENFFEEDYD